MVRARLLLGVVLLVASPGASLAKVASGTLESLTAGAEVIVVGQVERVVAVPGERRHRRAGSAVAVLKVEETLKGPAAERWGFLGTGTWTCDISGAALGERGLFFLTPYRHDGVDDLDHGAVSAPTIAQLGLGKLYRIAQAGRGRMPVRMVDGIEHVTLWVLDVELPPEVPTIDGPQPLSKSSIRSAPLDILRDLVREYVAAASPP